VTHIPAPIHIEFAGISKAYPNGVQALQDIDLTIRQGEIFGIIGRSGAGKSTLLRLFNRLENADSGEMFIHGESTVRYSTRQLRDLRRRVAMIFQHFNLMATKTVAQNIALPLKMAGVPAGERQRRVTRCLSWWASAPCATATRPAFPAARNSGPASPGRWSLSRKFCCAMRQPRRWIRKTPCRC
jgi:D-methionine transport system ATP-binding protein